MHLFAYGTLTFPEVWQRIAVCEVISEPARLNGFAIYRVRDAVFPGIVRAREADVVRGVLYRELDEETLFELDMYESDFYQRESVWVTTEKDEVVECQSYVVPQNRRQLLTDEPWDAKWFAEHELKNYLHGT